jgi:protein gp37
MADQTGIEWADSTFNPWMGCTKVSPACDHCYAERDTARFGRVGWGPGAPRVRTAPANWRKPLQWNSRPFAECTECGARFQPANTSLISCRTCTECGGLAEPARRRVFCASLADVFDTEVDPQWRVDLFRLIEDTPNLDWLILTKRIGNVAKMAPASWLGGPVQHGPDPTNIHGGWPAHAWIGATICNQADADRDIPKLLATPSAVRFVSIEPMLGPVDLSRWIAPTVYCGSCGEHYPPSEAIPDPDGHDMGADKCARCGRENSMGTWWGDDAINEASRPEDAELDDWDHGYKLHWVIGGGESGPHARPMHPAWVRSLRDQCAAAGVPFLFKQWGEWLPVEPSGSALRGCGEKPDREPAFRVENAEHFTKVGKKAAGRVIDGRTHAGVPDSTP